MRYHPTPLQTVYKAAMLIALVSHIKNEVEKDDFWRIVA